MRNLSFLSLNVEKSKQKMKSAVKNEEKLIRELEAVRGNFQESKEKQEFFALLESFS